jgi:hypothetical protein
VIRRLLMGALCERQHLITTATIRIAPEFCGRRAGMR